MPTKLPTPTPEIASKYQIVNGKFLATPKNDPKDRITIEIGDTKQEVFYPQIKIQRWDGEVNLSVRLKEDIEGSDISFEKGKIVWSKENLDASFYDIEPCEEHPEGGYEFDITLYKKPVSNKIEFILNTKGVDFFYQPELTKQEIKEGAFRPENVVGSYAVYTSENKTNWEGGKEYKVGKVGHIFRPKITDSVGSWVWGELNIDKEAGILSVIIPQTFLIRAVYPVRHAAGLTFGYSGAGGASAAYDSANYTMLYTAAPDSTGTVNSISVYAKYYSSGSTCKAVLWLTAGGTIITNGVGNTFTIPYGTTYNWRIATYTTNPTVTSGVSYQIGLVAATSTKGLYKYDTGSAGTGGYSSNNYTTPTSLGALINNTWKFSIYATYTASLGIALTGTVAPTITEANVVAGGKTIILTVTGDVWVVAAGGLFDAQRQNIINGIDSAQAEATGWDAEVKAKIPVTDVVRTSDTVVTITLSAEAGYNITATETITATVPGTALLLGTGAVATPTFTVTATAAGTNMQINIGDTFKTVASLQININDTWKDVSSIQENVGDTWRTVF